MTSSLPLEELLLESSLNDTRKNNKDSLSQKQKAINAFASKVLKSKVTLFPSIRPNQEEELLEKVCSNYSPSQQETTHPHYRTPLSELASLAYLKQIFSPRLYNLASQKSSNEAHNPEKVLFLDYLLQQLSKNRREKATKGVSTDEVLKAAVSSYLSQRGEKKLKETNSQINHLSTQLARAIKDGNLKDFDHHMRQIKEIDNAIQKYTEPSLKPLIERAEDKINSCYQTVLSITQESQRRIDQKLSGLSQKLLSLGPLRNFFLGKSLRRRMDQYQVEDSALTYFASKLIPIQVPQERLGS